MKAEMGSDENQSDVEREVKDAHVATLPQTLIQTDLLVDDVNMWVLCYSDGTTESIEELLGIHGEAELVVDNNGTGTIPATPDLDVDEDKHLEAVNRKLWADSLTS